MLSEEIKERIKELEGRRVPMLIVGTPIEEDIDAICERYPVNKEWLLTGEGEMLRRVYTMWDDIPDTPEELEAKYGAFEYPSGKTNIHSDIKDGAIDYEKVKRIFKPNPHNKK